MKKAVVNDNKCDKSPFCGAKFACPTKAISFKKTSFFSGNIVIDKEKCIGCGKCLKACPHNAISMK